MGIGIGKGKTRAVDAALSAISSPLLDFPIAQATNYITTPHCHIISSQYNTLHCTA